eukprot:1029531-Prorocentrum_minimum.AAC.1
MTTAKFIDSCKLPYIAPSLGGVESLIEQPTIVSYWDQSPEARAKIGIKDNLVRFACGVENYDDIESDRSSQDPRKILARSCEDPAKVLRRSSAEVRGARRGRVVSVTLVSPARRGRMVSVTLVSPSRGGRMVSVTLVSPSRGGRMVVSVTLVSPSRGGPEGINKYHMSQYRMAYKKARTREWRAESRLAANGRFGPAAFRAEKSGAEGRVERGAGRCSTVVQ